MIKQVQKLITLVAVWVSLPIFLMVFNPETLPLPLLIVPYIILYVGLYLTVARLIVIFSSDVKPAKRKLMAGIAAALPTLLLLLASIRQLSIRDSAIVVGLLVLLMFYLRRIDFIKNI